VGQEGRKKKEREKGGNVGIRSLSICPEISWKRKRKGGMEKGLGKGIKRGGKKEKEGREGHNLHLYFG